MKPCNWIIDSNTLLVLYHFHFDGLFDIRQKLLLVQWPEHCRKMPVTTTFSFCSDAPSFEQQCLRDQQTIFLAFDVVWRDTFWVSWNLSGVLEVWSKNVTNQESQRQHVSSNAFYNKIPLFQAVPLLQMWFVFGLECLFQLTVVHRMMSDVSCVMYMYQYFESKNARGPDNIHLFLMMMHQHVLGVCSGNCLQWTVHRFLMWVAVLCAHSAHEVVLLGCL